MARWKRRGVKLLVLGLVALLALAGCGKAAAPFASNQKPLVVATIYPIYDMALQIAGDGMQVEQLVPFGAEPHEYQPSPQDMKKVADADIFLYVGAGFETWVDQARQQMKKGALAVDTTQGIQLIPAGHGGWDPHVWLSPDNAKEMARTIAKALIQKDPAGKAVYEENLNKFIAQLDQLDRDFREGLKNATTKDFVVAHQAFGYLARTYGLQQIPIAGLTPEDEPSPQQLKDIIDTIRQLHVKYIGVEEMVPSKVADTIARETGARLVELSPIENITAEQAKEGVHFQDLLREDFDTLLMMLGAR
ncbi:MAG: metal ABC transporter substrate-binding protein [Clostridiales bacterium]|nr:metal ABC transporter substrate-binding protein [Clostridiales bacterium]